MEEENVVEFQENTVSYFPGYKIYIPKYLLIH